MSRPSVVRFATVVAVLLVLLALGLGFYLIPRKDDKPSDSSGMAFPEESEKAGIDFSMKFLPDEQGEKFKINLYDHGCGVAVADFDGDGLDDIYFLNQLGPNALYRNKGDGTFEDFTAKAG